MATSDTSVIIQVDLLANDAINVAENLGDQIRDLAAAQKTLRESGKQTTATYVSNAQGLRELQREQKAYVALASAEKGSNNQLRAQLSLLTAQYNALGKEERDNTTTGKALQVQVRAISDELKKNEGAVGDNRRNVGNYTASIQQAIGAQGPLSDGLNLLTQGFEKVSTKIAEVVAAQEAQRLATELNTAAIESQTIAETATIAATEANTVATAAQTAADTAAAEAERLRVIANEQLIASQAVQMEQEEAEIAILVQLANEQGVVIAAERARVLQEEALVAAQVEVQAAETARIAQDASVVASTTSVSAAQEAATLATNGLRAALLASGIGAFIVIIGSLITYLKDLDSFTDGYAQTVGGLKQAFNELGRSILNLDFKNLSQRLRQAGIDAAIIVELTQDLDDKLLAQSVKSAAAQAEVARKQLEARNRTLDPAARQKLLDDASKIDADDLQARKKDADERVQLAQSSIALTGNLNKDELNQLRKKGVDYALELQNNRVREGKIADVQTKELADALKNRIDIQNQFTQRDERRQNLSDRIADQAQKKQEAADAKAQREAEKLANGIAKVNEDRIKSEALTADGIITERQKEYNDVNSDIEKRKQLYVRYGQDTTQIENERRSRLSALTAKFNEQDIQLIKKNQQETQALRNQLIQDPNQRAQADRDLATGQSLDEVDRQILAASARIALGQNDQLEVLQSFVNKRKAIVDASNAADLQAESDLNEAKKAVQIQGLTDEFNSNQALIAQQEADKDRRIAINNEVLDSYSGLFGTIEELSGKQSILGKAAFLAQKAFAIQQIVTNAAAAESQIILRYEALKTQAVIAAGLIPFGGAFVAAAAVAALSAAEAAETGALIAKTTANVATIAASAIGAAFFATGGVYTSDGRGGAISGYSKTDNINSRLRSGEAVIVSEATQDPHTRNLLSAINVAYGGRDFSTPGYASGGVYAGTSVQTIGADLSSVLQQNNYLRSIVTAMRIQVAVTDINTAQAQYAQITDAGNF